jgi:hypothetical protein
MTLNRMTVLIATIFLAMAAAIGVAVAAGGGGSTGGDSGGKLLPSGTMMLLPWEAHQRALDRVVYSPHHMCDPIKHPGMKSDIRF